MSLVEAQYVGDLLDHGRLPIGRALVPSRRQLLIREMILQLKRGFLDRDYFQRKFSVDIADHWSPQWQQLMAEGMAEIDSRQIRLSREGLLRVDGLLPAFFEPQFQGARYT